MAGAGVGDGSGRDDIFGAGEDNLMSYPVREGEGAANGSGERGKGAGGPRGGC
jgi:hypothetical protein